MGRKNYENTEDKNIHVKETAVAQNSVHESLA